MASYQPRRVSRKVEWAIYIGSKPAIKTETLDYVVKVAETFVREHSNGERQFMLASGSAGIEAATNIVVRKASRTMLWSVWRGELHHLAQRVIAQGEGWSSRAILHTCLDGAFSPDSCQGSLPSTA
ncbi:hypothetical protein D9M68_646850 [compost metagenome]